MARGGRTTYDPAYQAAWYLRNRDLRLEQARAQNLARYGLTVADYDRMLADQRGVCKLCGMPPRKKRLAVDHDHATGRVRGLLCDLCNRTLGWLEARGLGTLAAYLGVA